MSRFGPTYSVLSAYVIVHSWGLRLQDYRRRRRRYSSVSGSLGAQYVCDTERFFPALSFFGWTIPSYNRQVHHQPAFHSPEIEPDTPATRQSTIQRARYGINTITTVLHAQQGARYTESCFRTKAETNIGYCRAQLVPNS